MTRMSRRSVIRASLGLTTVGMLARPHIANTAATTTIVWRDQGFVPEEDAAFRATVAAYEKASGNKLDLSIMPFMALNQKIVSVLTTGDVPDLIFHIAPSTILPQNAWNDKIEDVSDIVEAHKSELSHTALLSSSYYNSVTKRRAYYLAPTSQGAEPFHIWGDLVEKAGLNLADAPKTWDAYWDFFKPMQQALRDKGMRRIYAMGPQITTVGPNDGNGLMAHFMIANGGAGIVTEDGKLHTEDPQVREAAIRSVTWLTNAYKEGYVPPEALSWTDADDNNVFHEKLIVMDFDGSISTELAMIKDKKAYYEQIVTVGLPLGERRQTDASANRRRGPVHPEGLEECGSRQGLHALLPAAGGDECEPEGRAGSCRSGDPADRQGRSMVARSERPAPAALCAGIRAGADGSGLHRLQSGVGTGERRAALGPSACRCDQEWHDAGGGGGQGIQTDGSDLREVHVRVRLSFGRHAGVSGSAAIPTPAIATSIC